MSLISFAICRAQKENMLTNWFKLLMMQIFGTSLLYFLWSTKCRLKLN